MTTDSGHAAGKDEKLKETQNRSLIQCSLNGQSITLDSGMSIGDLAKKFGYTGKEFAVAVNTEFVPRSHYSSRYVEQGDLVDILAPVSGG